MDNNEQKSPRKAKLSDVNIKDKPLTLALTACFPSEIMQPVLSLFSLRGSPKVGEIQTCHTNKQGVTVQEDVCAANKTQNKGGKSGALRTRQTMLQG